MLNMKVPKRALRLPGICLILVFTLLGCLSTSFGQTLLGSAVGLVTDSTGAIAPGVQVLLVETKTGVQRRTTTNDAGHYAFPELPVGTYTIKVTQPGFKETTSDEILLGTQQTIRFDVTLEVGAVSDKIVVEAHAATLNTENAELGAVVTRNEIIDLPMNNASAMGFRYLSSSNQDGGYLAGQRSSFGFYAVDGVTAMTPAWGAWSGPALSMSNDAIQDITQVTATPSAEFGDVATISVSTRAGTNEFHGSGFWDTDNYALDAAGYYTHAKGKGPYKHYIGGSLGGPVVLPKLYNGRNRTFFFFNWEHYLQPGGHFSLADLPNQAMRGGDFSSLLAEGIQLYDPTSGNPFTGNIIPSSRINAVSAKIQNTKYIPLPNYGPSGAFNQNYLGFFPNSHPHYYPTVRIDHNFRDGKDVLSGRFQYRHQNEDGNTNGLPGFNQVQDRNTKNAYISETHLFTPGIMNEFRIGYAQDLSNYHTTNIGSDVLADWGLQLPNSAALKGLYGFPRVNFQNFTGLAGVADAGWNQTTREVLDNVTWTHGKHTTKAGFSVRRYKVDETSGGEDENFGVMNFESFGTTNPNPGSDVGSIGGYDYASFLLGIPHSSRTHDRGPNALAHYGTYSGYVQHDWRVSPSWNINFGLRWEKTTMPVDENDMRFTFDPATGNLVVPNQKVIDTLISPVFPKNIPIVTADKAGFPSRSLIQADQNWGPRFGFAYRAPQKFVVRGGFGLFYTPLVTYGVIDNFRGGPFQLSQTFQNELSNGAPLFQLPNPFTLLGSGDFPGVFIWSGAQNVRTPYTEQWNLTVEREINRTTIARVSYRGHHTLETLYFPDLNQPFVSSDPANEDLFRYPNFYNVYNFQNGGSEIGHLFEFQLQRKYAKGLTFDLGYTHTKVVTDARGSDIFAWPEYSWDLRRESGNENGLARHRFVGTAIWDLPFGSGKRFGGSLPGWVKQTLGNWQTSYIVSTRSGYFLDAGCGSCPDTSNARVWGGRPDLVGDPKVSNPTAQKWFNASAFAVPKNGTLGNTSTGVIVGPGLVNFDLGLFKYFMLRENLKLRFKMSASNIFNHPNLGNPNTNITSTTVGMITSTSGRGGNQAGYANNQNMRVIMMGARIEF